MYKIGLKTRRKEVKSTFKYDPKTNLENAKLHIVHKLILALKQKANLISFDEVSCPSNHELRITNLKRVDPP